MSIYLSYYLELKKRQNPGEKLPSLEDIKKNYIHYIHNVTGNSLEETATILDVPQTSLKKDINE
jgi:hypothetical protein